MLAFAASVDNIQEKQLIQVRGIVQKLKAELGLLKKEPAFAKQKIKGKVSLLSIIKFVDWLAIRFAGFDEAYFEADLPLFLAFHFILFIQY